MIGTAAAYLATIAFSRSWNSLDGLSSLTHVPVKNLLVIVVGMPLLAGIGGWLFAGREPSTMARQPLE